MWRNYLTVGIRALLKSRVYAVINIVGLAIGLAACLLILTYVRYEFSYDNWLPEAENTYELATEYLPSPQGQQPGLSLTTAYVAGSALKKDFPQVERVVWASSQNVTFLQDGTPTAAKKSFITDGPLFDIVRAPFVRGSAATALDDRDGHPLARACRLCRPHRLDARRPRPPGTPPRGLIEKGEKAHVAQLSYGRPARAREEPHLRLHQPVRAGDRPGRLPADPALRPV
jgi:hypothetical protein